MRGAVLVVAVVLVLMGPRLAWAAPPYGFESSGTTLFVHLMVSTKADVEAVGRLRRELRETLKIPHDRMGLHIWDVSDSATRASLQGYGIEMKPPAAGRVYIRIVLRSGDSEGYEASIALTAGELLFSLGVFAQDHSDGYSGTLLEFPVGGTMNAYREVLVGGDKSFVIPLASEAASFPRSARVEAVARLDRHGLQVCNPRLVGPAPTPSSSPQPTPAATPNADPTAEISQVYFQSYGRSPMADELAHWKPIFRQTGAEELGAQLRRRLRATEGSTERKQVVHRAFTAVLGRKADESELKFCEDAIMTNPAIDYSVIVANLKTIHHR